MAKAAGGGGAERAVQLLHRISPCPPFFHMEEDVLRHTLQVGFSPSGILSPARGPRPPQRAAGAGAGPFPAAADVAAAGPGAAGPGLPSAGGGPGEKPVPVLSGTALASAGAVAQRESGVPAVPRDGGGHGGSPRGAVGAVRPGEEKHRPVSEGTCRKAREGSSSGTAVTGQGRMGTN